jgi:hypothetical protein
MGCRVGPRPFGQFLSTPADCEEVLTILAPCKFDLLFALSYIFWTLTVHVLPGMGEAAAGAMDTRP